MTPIVDTETTIKEKIRKVIGNPAGLLKDIEWKLKKGVEAQVNRWIPQSPATRVVTELDPLNDIIDRSRKRSDISDHLVPMFIGALRVRPKLIVELGVRGGESTFIFQRVANLCGSRLISVDIVDCSDINDDPGWIFVQEDDIQFGHRFPDFCIHHGLPGHIDVLFIDTSHEYDHTVEEIATWFPLLSKTAKVFFHDTHMRNTYRRKDGSIGFSWDNQRGVIRALEDHFQKKFDERHDFIDFQKGWLIEHLAAGVGLTILERWEPMSQE